MSETSWANARLAQDKPKAAAEAAAAEAPRNSRRVTDMLIPLGLSNLF
jgi:hypothetical protein